MKLYLVKGLGGDVKGLYKIGITASERQRFRNLKYVFGEIEVIRIDEIGGQEVEDQMHSILIDRWVSREWFDLTRDDLKYYDDILDHAKYLAKNGRIPTSLAQQVMYYELYSTHGPGGYFEDNTNSGVVTGLYRAGFATRVGRQLARLNEIVV